jgi:hypothetical protein
MKRGGRGKSLWWLNGFQLPHGCGDWKNFTHHEDVAIEYFLVKPHAYGDQKVFGYHRHVATEFDHYLMALIKFGCH